jgi:hypothetical protein
MRLSTAEVERGERRRTWPRINLVGLNRLEGDGYGDCKARQWGLEIQQMWCCKTLTALVWAWARWSSARWKRLDRFGTQLNEATSWLSTDCKCGAAKMRAWPHAHSAGLFEHFPSLTIEFSSIQRSNVVQYDQPSTICKGEGDDTRVRRGIH